MHLIAKIHGEPAPVAHAVRAIRTARAPRFVAVAAALQAPAFAVYLHLTPPTPGLFKVSVPQGTQDRATGCTAHLSTLRIDTNGGGERAKREVQLDGAALVAATATAQMPGRHGGDTHGLQTRHRGAAHIGHDRGAGVG